MWQRHSLSHTDQSLSTRQCCQLFQSMLWNLEKFEVQMLPLSCFELVYCGTR